ncbi:MAG: hypothetical protein AAF518_10375 [Spirochaetota bacterium]
MDSFKHKPLLKRSELKQIKKSGLRVRGKKIVTDDVVKLKSLKYSPDLSEEEAIHYYKEPILIEYYIPKESRFALEIKFLYIFLAPPQPREEETFLKDAIRSDSFIDVFAHSQSLDEEQRAIFDRSYQNLMSIIQRISEHITQYMVTENAEFLKTPIFLTETLMQFEPTIAALEIFGNYIVHNLNWLIKRLNQGKMEFSLEDRTISYLIKRRDEYWDEKQLEEDEDFEIFSELFYQQAYPHRGAAELTSQDFLLD